MNFLKVFILLDQGDPITIALVVELCLALSTVVSSSARSSII